MKRNVLVLGNAGGGTSMVAGILRILGIDMGRNFHDSDSPTHEDVDFYKAKDGREVSILINERNLEEEDTWGWKCPHHVRWLDDFIGSMVNPHIILVFRDPVAVSTSRRPVNTSVRFAHEVNQQMVEIHEKYADNEMIQMKLLSYERALKNEVVLIHDVSQFLGLSWEWVKANKLQEALYFIDDIKGYQDIK